MTEVKIFKDKLHRVLSVNDVVAFAEHEELGIAIVVKLGDRCCFVRELRPTSEFLPQRYILNTEKLILLRDEEVTMYLLGQTNG